MSRSERRSREDGCELKPYTNWPLILGAASCLIAGAVAVAMMPRQTPDAPAKPRPRQIAEAPVPRLPAHREAAPTPAVEEQAFPARPVAVEHVGMLGMPRVETAASLALERMTFFPVDPFSFDLRSPVLKRPVLSETELLRLLLDKSKEIDIGKDAHTALTKGSSAKGKEGHAEASHRALGYLVRSRADLSGLPLVAMKECELSAEEGKALAGVSRLKATSRGESDSSSARERHGSTATFEVSPSEALEMAASGGRITSIARRGVTTLPESFSAVFVRPLRQIFEVQPEKGRLALAQLLAKSRSAASARALVRLAVFDLSERVRAEAVQQLPSQDKATVRAELLAAFRHPWAPAAVHAAKAVDRLGDRGMIPALQKLLAQPDPSAPFQEEETWYVRELVRVNHLKNCLLCHPAAGEKRPTVGGPVPLRDRELPRVYYASRSRGVPLVDASTIYLRQDFSVLHELKDAKPWPEVQRFDYLVRTRRLRADEIPKKEAEAGTFTYPQREAIRELLEVLELKEPARMGS